MLNTSRLKSVAGIFNLLLSVMVVYALADLIIRFEMGGMLAYDNGWLIQTGKYILENGHLPDTDIFSWSQPDRDWILYQWLFEVAVGFLHETVGSIGLVTIALWIFLLTYLWLPMLLFKSNRLSWSWAIAICIICWLPANLNVAVRPQLVTSLLLLLQYYLLHLYRDGRLRKGVLLPMLAFMYALWANLHMGLVMGLMSLAIMALGDHLERKRWYQFQPPQGAPESDPVPWRDYLMALAVCLLASLANPYGWGIYSYLADLSAQTDMNSMIKELQPYHFGGPVHLVYFFIMLCFVLVFHRSRQLFRAEEYLHLVFYLFAPFFAARFIFWSSLYFCMISLLAMNRFAARGRFRELPHPFLSDRQRTTMAISVFTIFLVTLPAPAEARYGWCHELKPSLDAYVEALPEDGSAGMHGSRAGSCLIMIHPDKKVFIDTRYDFYGQDFTMKYARSFRKCRDWRDFLRSNGSRVVHAWNEQSISLLLEQSRDFERVYRDDVASVYRRTAAPSKQAKE